jgi:hypothetical protein
MRLSRIFTSKLNKLSDEELDARGLAAGGWIQEGMRRDAEA